MYPNHTTQCVSAATECNCFDPLQKTVSLLVVDNDPEQLEWYSDNLSAHPLISVRPTSTASQAECAIRHSLPGLCIFDFGMDDIEKDEFYLLKKHAHHLPIVIISGSGDIERAFSAAIFGAAGMIAKPPDLASRKFWRIIKDMFLNRTILPPMTATMNPQLRECCRVLRDELPENVSEWAHRAGITDAYLRRLWTDCYSRHPKHVLFMYRLYKNAFEYFTEIFLANQNEQEPRLSGIDKNASKQWMEYYLLNIKTLGHATDSN